MRAAPRLSRSRLRRPLACALAAVLIASGCEPPSTPLEPTGTATIEVLGSNGAPIGGALVSVPEEGSAALGNADGEATLVVSGGSHTFTVRYPGCAPMTFDLDVPAATNVEFTVTLSCGDAVEDTATPGAERIWVLAAGSDAGGTATCGWERPFIAAGLNPLGFNATARDATDAPCDLVAFVTAADVAPHYTNVAADLPWTSGLGDRYAPAMPAARLALPMHIIISQPGLTASQRATIEELLKADLEFAIKALDASFSGIELVDPSGGPPQHTYQNTAAVSTVLAGGCRSVADIRANPAIYSRGRLNVYYTPAVTSETGAPKGGYSCQTSGAPEILFVDWDSHFIATLAHEIGHALGLMFPYWGHSSYYEGFYRDLAGREHNVMADAVSALLSPPDDERYFSVGQVARMHLSDASWLNFPSASDNTSLRRRLAVPASTTALTCGCPETAATSACPAANADIDRAALFDQMSAASPFTFTCGVSVDVPAATVCEGAAVTVTASLLPGTDPEKATTLWVSLDPKIATVTPVPGSTPTTFGAKIQGVLAGSTTIRAYADGAYFAITLTVTSPPC